MCCVYYTFCPFALHRFGVSLENEFEIIRFFDKIDSWGMDMFNLNEMTKGHPLVTTSCAIFRV